MKEAIQWWACNRKYFPNLITLNSFVLWLEHPATAIFKRNCYNSAWGVRAPEFVYERCLLFLQVKLFAFLQISLVVINYKSRWTVFIPWFVIIKRNCKFFRLNLFLCICVSFYNKVENLEIMADLYAFNLGECGLDQYESIHSGGI